MSHPCRGSKARAPGSDACGPGWSGRDHGFHAKARSSDALMTIFLAGALGPRRWGRSQARAIRGHSRRPPGGPGCRVSARAWWAGKSVWQRSQVHAKARSREVPMSEGQFFVIALRLRRWSRFSTKAIRGDSRRPPGGLGCRVSARVRWPGWLA
jgi:hypothetical protein